MKSEQELLKETLVMVLAGGQGERLHPLTKDRAKPAVPFGGKYRIIDFSLSNCLNSGLRRIAVLTQYKSISLDRHLREAWGIFNHELGEYVESVPPQLRQASHWYLGTADAIFQNVYTLEQERPERVLILSGDHVYKMDYRQMISAHIEKNADLTVACMEFPVGDASRFGVMQVDSNFRITDFKEKPANPPPIPGDPTKALINMGVYLFNTRILVQRSSEDSRRASSHDFGKDIIPEMVRSDKVFAYSFRDENKKQMKYWRDIGTLEAYWEANMDLCAVDPLFDLYDPSWPIRTWQPQKPPAKTVFSDEHPGGRRAQALDSLMCDGCIISGATVKRSILSPGVKIEGRSYVEDSILFDDVQVGFDCVLRKTIVDKRVAIPNGTRIGVDPAEDAKRFTVSPGGIVVVPKDFPFA
ncbi:MAG TPA: glucose-1-phosphate adenylyltransferase [Candidatus Brocadiia bacterium]|nr:glucose-1-phosphate adenylyltransferase [Candidatus Brocadiia bacterium]